MKLEVDENLPVEVADTLSEAGFDAVTVVAQNLGGRPDPDIIGVRQREERVLITLDVGFADIRSYPPDSYPGIIVFRLARQDMHHVLAVTAQLPALLQREAVDNRLWIVEEQRLRIRS